MATSYREHEIEGTENLIWSSIKDQAGGWKQAVRELVQNGVDEHVVAEVDEAVEVTYSPFYTRVRDYGRGRNLKDPESGDIDLLTNMGETDKDSNDEVIGEFGHGKGVAWSIGVVRITSGRMCLIFNIRDWGLEPRAYPVPEEHAVDGMEVMIYHWDDQVPEPDSRKWDEYDEDIRDRFSYLELATGCEVQINGKVESDQDIDSGLTNKSVVVETDNAWISLEQNTYGNLDVYSNGVYVKDIRGEGLSGQVVTKENLSLDLSRNDIKEGCDTWQTVQEEIDEAKQELLGQIPDNRLNRRSREAMMKMMSEDPEVKQNWQDREIFKMTNGDQVSLEEISDKEEIGTTDSHGAADDLINEGEVVLDSSDNAVRAIERDDEIEIPDEFDIGEKAEEHRIESGYREINDAFVSGKERRRLLATRDLADRLGVDREIVWGEDDSLDAWTDGQNKIVITEDVVAGDTIGIWAPSIRDTLVRMYSWEQPSRDTTIKTSRYKDRFEEYMDDSQRHYRNWVRKIKREGITHWSTNGLTENEQDLAVTTKNKLRGLSERDRFYKNRESRACTVTEIGHDTVVFNDSRGNECWVDTEEDGFPTVHRSGTDGTLKRITVDR
jgi:hypothetical protein